MAKGKALPKTSSQIMNKAIKELRFIDRIKERIGAHEVVKTSDAMVKNRGHFGIDLPNHVQTFLDDGTDASVRKGGYWTNYYGSPPDVTSYIYYDSNDYDRMFIASCSDGSRYFTENFD